MKLPIDALYIKLSKNIRDISIIFEKIFWSISVVDAQEFKAPQKLSFNLIIVDCRGVVVNYESTISLLEEFSSVYSLLIYDYSNQEKIHNFIKAKIDFFLPYPIKREELKIYLQKLIKVVSFEEKLKKCKDKLKYYQVEIPEEKIAKTDCIDLQKHFQIVEGLIKKSCRDSTSLLQNILTMNRLLIQSDLNERDISFLGSAIQSINQLKNIFEDLERFITPEEQFRDSAKVPFNINAILENIGVVMSKYWGEGGLNLIFNIANSVPAKILGNPIILSKALVSILEIAIEIKKEGEIILDVAVKKGRDREFLYFNPIRAERLTKEQKDTLKKMIYKPQFLRVKSLVEMMNGTFLAKDGDISELGFVIPLIRIDRRNYRLPSKEWMNKNILIIERNEFVSNALEGMLNYFHYKVQKSDNIQDAENKLYQNTFDFIFLDEELFDSFEVYGYPLKREAKVVVMAWPATQKRKISDYLAKSDTVIIKPFTQEKVFNTILELYSSDILQEQREALTIMKENLGFLLQGKRALYIGESDSNWLMIRGLLKGSLMGILRAHSIENIDVKIKSSDLIIISPKIYEDKNWRSWLSNCSNSCKGKNVIALIESLNSKLISAIKKVGINQYLLTPINPENFYRILMEELMG